MADKNKIKQKQLERRKYSIRKTLVVPGRFFESPRHIRISYGCRPTLLQQGLNNISRALDDLS
jgi:bifunctional pyridoxal-dependent enzyme with beta-cystathionase and maltose regulon repressor activities